MTFVNFATTLVASVELHHLAGLYRSRHPLEVSTKPVAIIMASWLRTAWALPTRLPL